MKIQQLLQREPFGDILEVTLQCFLRDRFGENYRVTWYPHNPGLRAIHRRGQQAWFCNLLLNAIFAEDTSSDVLAVVRKGYAITPFRWRRHLQRGYVALATHNTFAPRMASCALGIQPPLPGAEHILIMGGNNKIRVIDVVERRVWEVLKVGFDPICINREIEVRNAPDFWPVPALRSVASDHAWFEEEYVNAVALNRLPYDRDHRPFVAEAFSALQNWIERTRTVGDTAEYVDGLVAGIKHKVERATLITSAEKEGILRWLGSARRLLDQMMPGSGRMLPLAVGHGDFQDGNILVGNDRLWLVDWEHSLQRQALYDVLVFALRSRFPSGLTMRIQNALDNPQSLLEQIPIPWDDLAQAIRNRTLRLVLAIFLLEELDWNLEENSNPLFLCQSGAWLLFRKEMGPSLACVATST